MKHSTRPSSRPLKDSSQDKNHRKCWRRHAPTSRPVIGLCLLSHAKTKLPMFGFREALSSGVAMEAVRLSFHSRRVDSVFHHEGAAISVSTLQICGRNGLLQGVPAFRALPFLQDLPCRLPWTSISPLTARRLGLQQSCCCLHPLTSRGGDFEFSLCLESSSCLTIGKHAELPQPVTPQVKGASRLRAARCTAGTQIPVDIYVCVCIYIYIYVCPHTCIRVC